MLQLGQGADLAEVNAGSQQAPVAYGDASYWVEAVDLGNDLYTLTATGIENGVGSRLDLVVREATDTFYVWAAFGDEGLQMSANVRTDSYNSNLGPYSDQDVNGSGTHTRRVSGDRNAATRRHCSEPGLRSAATETDHSRLSSARVRQAMGTTSSRK